jgi:hypothetical protein
VGNLGWVTLSAGVSTGVVLMIGVLVRYRYDKSVLHIPEDSLTGRSATAEPTCIVHRMSLLTCYPLFILAMHTFIEGYIPFDDRIMSPMQLALTVVIGMGCVWLIRR